VRWRGGVEKWPVRVSEIIRKRDFVRSCQRLVPEVGMEDTMPGASGVRAQAVGPDDALVDDFRFVERERFLHVLNVPSPAANSISADRT
jgi:L-2-hydroxyglutarate oxidase